jgi:hypothetical protein
MNARYTHAPDAVRARLYGAAVKAGGPVLLNMVRRARLTDQLIAIAHA